MTKIEPIDPASTDASLEMIHNYQGRAVEEKKNIQTKDDSKVTHTASSIVNMIIGGRFPSTDELSINENGEYSGDSIEAFELTMSTAEWQKRGLLQMGASRQNTSLFGANLHGNTQAFKAKQAFIDMSREVINKFSTDVSNVFG